MTAIVIQRLAIFWNEPFNQAYPIPNNTGIVKQYVRYTFTVLLQFTARLLQSCPDNRYAF